MLSAIDEEVGKLSFSTPPGARSIEEEFQKKRAEPMRDRFTRIVRKPRTLALLLLLLVAVIQLALVYFSEERKAELDRERVNGARGAPALHRSEREPKAE